jgi:hypothetical protein
MCADMRSLCQRFRQESGFLPERGVDSLENACLLLTVEGAGSSLPFLGTMFAACKFAPVAAAFVYLVAGIAGLLGSRLPCSGPPSERFTAAL